MQINSAQNPDRLRALSNGFKHKQNLTVVLASDGSLQIKPLGLFSNILHWNDTEFHKKRFSRLAGTVAKTIAMQPRMSIPEAANDPSLKTARKLLKEIKIKNIHSPAINCLKKEVTAAKLGISSYTFNANPGLQNFAENNHLERYLLYYGDTMDVNPETKEAFLRNDGIIKPWQKIHEEMKTWVKSNGFFSNQPWIYGQNGIQNKDMYDWTELKPFTTGNPADWNHQYVFEFCSCHDPEIVKRGNHTWIRLKTPTGDIYSVGLYSWTNHMDKPLKTKPGSLMSPDVSEFWDFPIETVDFRISKETFLKIKETVETDKKKESLVFQLFNNNCLLYCKNLAKFGGIDIPTLENILFFITPKISAFIGCLPKFVQKICFIVSTPFLNLAQAILGAHLIDASLNEEQRKRTTPHLSSFWDLFNIKKNYLNHPRFLTFKISPEVKEWRKKEIEALHKTENDADARREKEKKINLTLPPSFYTKTSLNLEPV